MSEQWYGFDFDGSLVVEDYENFYLCGKETPLVALMVKLLDEGKKVKIFTARTPEYRGDIYHFLARNGLENRNIEITSVKDGALRRFYDDRAIGVNKNTGMTHDIIIWNTKLLIEAYLNNGDKNNLHSAISLLEDTIKSIDLTKIV